jgi:hypothetical protein
MCIKNRRETAAPRRRAERRNTSILSSALAAHNKHQAFDCILLLLRPLQREKKGDRKLRGGALALVMANFLSHSQANCDLSLLNEPIN